MAKICLCLTAKTLAENLEILNKYRKYTDIAELRVDCLDPNERLLIRSFPEQAELPVILTIRRTSDGGYYAGGEGARVNLFARGLAYADANRRMNFAYVDLEEDLDVPSLEEAARTFGTRIIRSWHSVSGKTGDIPAKIRGMKCLGSDLVKIAVTANSASDVLNVLRASRECPNHDKIFLCMGKYGVYSRILAEQFGSFLTYASAPDESNMISGAEGQIDVRNLNELYRFHSISKSTKIYGVAGNPQLVPESPHFFNSIFTMEDLDAVFVPFSITTISDFMELADELNISGLSLTSHYKEDVLPFLSGHTAQVASSGACNTICKGENGWSGTNTDVQVFSDLLTEFTGRQNLKKRNVTLIGAGSMARIIASELYKRNARVLVLNRSIHMARDLAARYNFAWGGLDIRGIEMVEKFRDIIIEATSVGTYENDSGEPVDPLELYAFSGREAVIDLAWGPEPTRFLARAAEAGCRTTDGYDMLSRQAQYQYAQFMGRDIPPQLLSRVQYGRS